MVRSLDSFERVTDQYPAFASNLEKYLASAKSGLISSRVGILCGHLFKFWLSLFGSKQTRSSPLGLTLVVMELHQSVWCVTFCMTLSASILSSAALSFGFR